MPKTLPGIMVGENISYESKDGLGIFYFDPAYRGARSASGKSIRVSSTEGNRSIPGLEAIKMGMNLYTQPE